MSEKKGSKLIRFLGYAIPILLVVYVLSTGPVLLFYYGPLSTDETNSALDILYAPMFYAMKNDLIAEGLIRYANFSRRFCNFYFESYESRSE